MFPLPLNLGLGTVKPSGDSIFSAVRLRVWSFRRLRVSSLKKILFLF